MELVYKNLTIRSLQTADAEQLCEWWNDRIAMAREGFPNGLGCTPEEIREIIANDTGGAYRRHIIELDGKPIGEMNYRGRGMAAELGIEIHDSAEREKGYGTTLLTIFTDALFTHYGFEKAMLSANGKNERARYVYEKKLGFRLVGIEKDSWRNYLGEPQSTVNFEIDKAEWFAAHKERPPYVYRGQ